MHDGDRWLVGYVSARRFFRFHPVLATGPSLDALTLLAEAGDRRATEGTTLVRVEDRWWVVASDGRDGRRGERRGYPVFDLRLRQVGALDAPYPSNLPWPNLARDDRGWLLVTFDGAPAGGYAAGLRHPRRRGGAPNNRRPAGVPPRVRHRWRHWLALAFVLGVASGALLALVSR